MAIMLVAYRVLGLMPSTQRTPPASDAVAVLGAEEALSGWVCSWASRLSRALENEAPPPVDARTGRRTLASIDAELSNSTDGIIDYVLYLF
jgi:hypothetical protein